MDRASSAQPGSRAVRARRDPHQQPRLQPGRRGHRRPGFLPRCAPAHLREDGRADRPEPPGRSRHAQGRARPIGELDEVGGPAYISALTDGVPRSANVEHYARIVKEKSTLRRLIQSATDVLSRAYDAEEDADDLLDEAERSIFQIADDRMRSGFVRVSELVDSGYQLIEQLQQHRGLVTGVPSGFVDLDEMTSGFQPSDLVIVAARPSMGKTSFVMNVAHALRHRGGKDRRCVQPRDVEGTVVPAPADVRGASRRAPLPRRISRRAGLRTARPGVRRGCTTRTSSSTTRRRSASSRCAPRPGG